MLHPARTSPLSAASVLNGSDPSLWPTVLDPFHGRCVRRRSRVGQAPTTKAIAEVCINASVRSVERIASPVHADRVVWPLFRLPSVPCHSLARPASRPQKNLRADWLQNCSHVVCGSQQLPKMRLQGCGRWSCAALMMPPHLRRALGKVVELLLDHAWPRRP
jgi:hypothetical protein